MPTFGGVPLLQAVGGSESGVAFRLNEEPSEDVTLDFDAWTLDVRRGVKCLVVKGGQDTDYDGALDTAHASAQKGLDLVCIRTGHAWSVSDASDSHVVWWPETGGLVVCWVSLATSCFRAEVQIQVTGADGAVRPPTPAPQVPWHESFRYFRVSQSSDDLFDAYRNAFLALESILSSIHPPVVSGGRVKGGEANWLREALEETERRGAALTSYVPAQTTDPVGYLHRELYENRRCCLNHAKSGLPHNGATGEWTADSVDLSGEQVVRLQATGAVDTATPHLATKTFSIDGGTLAVLSGFRHVLGCTPDGKVMLISTSVADLVPANLLRFEAKLGIRGTGFGQPKKQFTL